jgi:hypothetical protein
VNVQDILIAVLLLALLAVCAAISYHAWKELRAPMLSDEELLKKYLPPPEVPKEIEMRENEAQRHAAEIQRQIDELNRLRLINVKKYEGVERRGQPQKPNEAAIKVYEDLMTRLGAKK